jgi:hypothetical protein
MTTVSKAKSRLMPPEVGANSVIIPNAMPASATVAKAMAAAMPKMCR